MKKTVYQGWNKTKELKKLKRQIIYKKKIVKLFIETLIENELVLNKLKELHLW